MKGSLRKFSFVLTVIMLNMLSGLVFAQFSGDPKTQWISEPGKNDRKMKILEDFSYTDIYGTVWLVPENWVVDGASIPKFFWNKIGSPFVGNFRRASVVHDYYCDIETKPWQEVHRMFYDASIEGGVSKFKAKLMYAAVYYRGPRWGEPGVLGAAAPEIPILSQDDLEELEQWIISDDPSLIEIESRF